MTPTKIRRAALAAALILSGSATLAVAQTAPAPKPAPTPKPAAAAKPAAPKPAATKPAAKPATQAAPSESGPTACVASALGHTFRVQKVGLMIFGNALDEVATESWGIDDAVVSSIQRALSGKYAVRRLPVSGQTLNALEQAGAGGLLFGGSGSAVAGPLRAAAGGARCDLYVAVTRAAAQFGGTNQTVAGLGIVQRGGLLESVYVHAIFDVRTYDSNFTAIRSERAAMQPLLVSGMVPPGIYGMYREVDGGLFPATPQAAAQSAQLKATTRDLVNEGLAKTLPGMM
jgi:hypothetical protein